jgi:hypothetical protein
MFTENERSIVNKVVEKKRQDPLYRASPSEQALIDVVLAHPHTLTPSHPHTLTPKKTERRG